jgi:hypothetical protein
MPTSESELGCAHTRDCAPCHHHLQALRVLHSCHICTWTAPHTSATGWRPPRSYQCQKLLPKDTHLHWDVACCHLSSSPESHRVATFAPGLHLWQCAPEHVYLHYTCSGVTRICRLGRPPLHGGCGWDATRSARERTRSRYGQAQARATAAKVNLRRNHSSVEHGIARPRR